MRSSNLQLFNTRDKPFFHQASQSKLWANPLTKKPKQHHRSNLLDNTRDTNRKSEEKNTTAYNPTVSKINHTSSHVDLEILHELPYKDNIISRYPPLKLQKVISCMTEDRSSRLTTIRPKKLNTESGQLSGYLDYLNSSSNSNLGSFRTRMFGQPDKSQTDFQPPQDPQNEWIDNLMPLELRNLPSIPHKHNKRPTLNLTETSSLDLNLKLNNRKYETKPSIADEIHLFAPSPEKLARTISISTDKARTRFDFYPETSTAQKLAEEIVSHYRLYQENTIKNRELQIQMNNFLKDLGVAEIFLGKIYKHLPLSMRIYRHMVEADETKGISKSPSFDKLSNMKSRQFGGILKPKLIQSRYNTYLRIHEKIQDLNIEFKLQGVQNLENRLLQAHEALKDREVTALKSISRRDKQRYNQMKAQFSNPDRYDLLVKETENGFDLENDDYDEGPRFKKELRIVNNRLDAALKHWKTNLTQEFDYGYKY